MVILSGRDFLKEIYQRAHRISRGAGRRGPRLAVRRNTTGFLQTWFTDQPWPLGGGECRATELALLVAMMGL